MISVIIPTSNEISYGYLAKILKRLNGLERVEVICVDNESVDGTKELIQKYGVKLLETSENSRGQRMTYGSGL